MGNDYSIFVEGHDYISKYLAFFQRATNTETETYDEIVSFKNIIDHSVPFIRDMTLHPIFSIPSSVMKYLSENEAEFVSNQLLYTKLTPTSDDPSQEITSAHVDSAITLIAQSLQETAEWIYNKNTSTKERFDFMFNRSSFPYHGRFPYLSMFSQGTGLKWGITIAIMPSETMQFKPCIMIPYYGNTIVMIVTDAASHACSLVFHKLEWLRSHIEAVEKTTKLENEKLRNKVNESEMIIESTGALTIEGKNDFLLVPRIPIAKSTPIIHTLQNRILASMFLPAFTAYSKCEYDKKRLVMKETVERLQFYLSCSEKLSMLW